MTIAPPSPLKNDYEIMKMLEHHGMEQYYAKKDSLGWMTILNPDEALNFIADACVESGYYDTVSGYLYNPNRYFNIGVDEFYFYHKHGVIELATENVHIPIRRAQEVRFMIEDGYALLFYVNFGNGSGVAFRFTYGE